ncbi:hypothetical protein Tco_1318551 [Tanacetum coccineum]
MLMRIRLSGSEAGSSSPEMTLVPWLLRSTGFARGSFPSFFWRYAPIGAPESLFWNLHVKVSKEFLFPYPADHFLNTSMFSLTKSREYEEIGKSGPTDGANVEAYLRGMLGLGKWALNIRIAWFSFGSFGGGSFGGVSFGSSARNLNHHSIIYLSLDYCSGIECLYHKSLQRSQFNYDCLLWMVWTRGLLRKSDVCSGCLLRMSAPTWRDLLDLSLGLRVVDYHYLLLISWRRYTSS